MITILKDATTVLNALADFIVEKAAEAIAARDRFNFVLSGGSSPKKLYEILASDAYRKKVAWEKVYFFFGDERYVPLDHADSNYRMARESLFAPLGIPSSQVFPVNTALTPQEAAVDYEQTLRSHFKNESCIFDLTLLGLGDNSHTASLFPHTSVLHEKKSLIKEIYVEEVKMYRITFTAPLINMGRDVAFLVYGAGKAEAVRHILKDPTNIEEYPAQLIDPTPGALHWFLDEGAAALVRVN